MASKNMNISATVQNTLFPHIATATINIAGPPAAVNRIIDDVARGYRADEGHANLYEAIAHYMNKHFSAQTHATGIRELYFSRYIRSIAKVKFSAEEFARFDQDHGSRKSELSSYISLIPAVFQAWFEVKRIAGGSPVTRVGLVSHRVIENRHRYHAALFLNTSTNETDRCVWFVCDIQPLPGRKPWATLNRTAAPAAQANALARLANQLPTRQTVPGPHLAEPGSAIPVAKPVPSFVHPVAPVIPPSGSIANLAPMAPSTFIPPRAFIPVAPSAPALQQARHENTRLLPFVRAPHWDTALPWELLADCTIEELLVYYPNHVLNWPGLAMLAMHYIARICGKSYSLINYARLIAKHRGITHETFNQKVRALILQAGCELDNQYDPEEQKHHRSIYKLVRQFGDPNVSALLQRLIYMPPQRLNGVLRPAVPLHEVGANITGVHPHGNFAHRVIGCMNAHKMGIANFEATIARPPGNIPHPMIGLLADYTKDWTQRVQESQFIWEHNETAPDHALIRPVELFKQAGERKYARIQGDASGQIWEMFDERQTLFNWLDNNMTREELVQNHWRDISHDAQLWLEITMAPGYWTELLPKSALVEKGIPPNKADPSHSKPMKAFKDAKRKGREGAIIHRLKGVGEWDESKKKQTSKSANSAGDPENSATYKKERARFDTWAAQQRQPKIKKAGKRPLVYDPSTRTSQKRPRVQQTAVGDALADPHGRPQQEFGNFDGADVQTHGTHEWLDYDDLALYCTDSKGVLQMVFRDNEPSGSVPEWWRMSRFRKFWDKKIEIDHRQANEYFDAGYDVIPDLKQPVNFQILVLPGNFNEAPICSPPRQPSLDAGKPTYAKFFDDQDLSLFEEIPKPVASLGSTTLGGELDANDQAFQAADAGDFYTQTESPTRIPTGLTPPKRRPSQAQAIDNDFSDKWSDFGRRDSNAYSDPSLNAELLANFIKPPSPTRSRQSPSVSPRSRPGRRSPRDRTSLGSRTSPRESPPKRSPRNHSGSSPK